TPPNTRGAAVHRRGLARVRTRLSPLLSRSWPRSVHCTDPGKKSENRGKTEIRRSCEFFLTAAETDAQNTRLKMYIRDVGRRARPHLSPAGGPEGAPCSSGPRPAGRAVGGRLEVGGTPEEERFPWKGSHSRSRTRSRAT